MGRVSLALILSVLFVQPARADDLTFEQALAQAEQAHETGKLAELTVERAEAELEGARSDFLPTLTLGASATARAQEDAAGRYLTGSGNLTLTQPLLRPSAIPRLWAAQHSVRSAEHGRDEAKRELSFETARAYLSALAADRFLDAAESRLKRARANLDNAQARADAELNSINDVTRAKLDVSSAVRDVAQRKRDRVQARLALEVLVGVPVGALAPPSSLFSAAQTFAADDQLAGKATQERNDLKSLHEQVLAARELANEPNYRLIPSLELVGQLRVNPDPLPSQLWHEETLTLSLSWTIFDGGQRYADRRAQLAQAKSAEIEKSRIERTLSAEVRTAVAGLEAARETYELATQAKSAAATNTKETNDLYQQGLARAIEVTDANAEEYAAEIEAAASKIEMALSYLEVRLALGKPPLDKPGGKK